MARLLCFILLCLFPCLSAAEQTLSHHVLVTVSPHKYLVERIAGDTLTVGVVVPPAANVHIFEPTPKQMIAASHADLWFRIGEPFEKRLVRSLTAHQPDMRIIDLRRGLDLIKGECHHDHGGDCPHGDAMDLHYWLSPRLLKIQAKAVAAALSQRYPEQRVRYEKALAAHLAELDALDRELQALLAPVEGQTVVVAHPAYGYLVRDYGLHQLSIEMEGRDPTPQQLTTLLRQMQAVHPRIVFTQSQYNPKVAQLVANQLGARLISLDPYAENYMDNLRFIAKQFAAAVGNS